MVLLGGDLFHDNKPSRNTVVKAMDILSKHCLNDRPIKFEILSDQVQNFTSGRVNFENPNYNIGLPVFTIHGNHDDPSGAENLSAVDILSTGNLVNYFGKVPIAGGGVGKVRIAPVLIRKGKTLLAMYGLGNLRDERLCRLFQTPGAVEWIRPADAPSISKNDWFNMFVLHQNRIPHGQNAKNCIRESHLAKFLDIIIWGHEHECFQEAWESVEGNFSVLQPGSTVATALSEGESKRKHCFMLEIQGHNWRTTKFALETVRPFTFGSVVLAEHKLDAENQESVMAFLEQRVTSMVAKSTRSQKGSRTPQLPLVRLRVDYTGFSTINTQRFGQRFVGKVANPHDIILWQKAAVRRKESRTTGEIGANEMARPEALDETKISDLIAQHLSHDLQILPELELTNALHDFVEKDNKAAIHDTIGKVLQETQNAVSRRRTLETGPQGEDDIEVLISEASKHRKATQPALQQTTARQMEPLPGVDDVRHEMQSSPPESTGHGSGKTPAPRRTNIKATSRRAELPLVHTGNAARAVPVRQPRTGTNSAKKKSSEAATADGNDHRNSMSFGSDDAMADIVSDSDGQQTPVPMTRKRGRGAAQNNRIRAAEPILVSDDGEEEEPKRRGGGRSQKTFATATERVSNWGTLK